MTRRWVKRASVAVAAVVALLLAYGVAVEPRLVLDEREIIAELPGLDAS